MQDFKYAIRFLARRWGMSTVAVVVMGLGIALTTTMFAIIDGVVLTGPNFEAPEEIALLRTTIPKSRFNQSVRIHDYLDWKEQQSVFEEMSASYGVAANLSGDDSRAETYPGVRVSASTFDLVGWEPLLGRTFTEDEDLRTDLDVVVIGYQLWQNRFDGDPGIVGRSIRVNARPTTVIGVMPEGFAYPENEQIWLPLNVDPGELERREGPGMSVLGRLSDGVAMEQARSQMEAIGARLTDQYPEANREIVPVLLSWVEEEFVGDDTRAILWTMFVAVIGVLLIACANVANLLFALTINRGRELAVRSALGAGRRRVLRQLLSETLVLAGGGALLGTVQAKFSLDLFERVVVPLNPPAWMTFGLSPEVLGFTIAISGVAALASGILPALHATRGDVQAILQDQARGSSGKVSRWSTWLVGLEVAVSCGLLVGAGLMVKSTINVGASDYGLDREGILTARLVLPALTYPDSTARGEIMRRVELELERMPGVSQVAVTSSLPILGTSLRFYGVRDREYADDGEYAFGGYTRVTPDFFDIIDVPIVQGRNFDASDRLGSPRVVIVDQRFAERNWPGQDPLGKQVRLGRSASENPWMTVVGVVRTFEMLQPLSFAAQTPEGMFVPMGQEPTGGFSVMLRASGDPLALAGSVRETVDRIDLDIPVNRLDMLEAHVDQASLDFAIIGGMFAIFGAVALMLASMGLYAVMAFTVSRRGTEVGIRMALGASPGGIVKLVMSQGAKPVLGGLAFGLVLAFLLGRALSSFLFDVSAVDPVMFAGIPLILTAVSALALLLPANRAARIAPASALRED